MGCTRCTTDEDIPGFGTVIQSSKDTITSSVFSPHQHLPQPKSEDTTNPYLAASVILSARLPSTWYYKVGSIESVRPVPTGRI